MYWTGLLSSLPLPEYMRIGSDGFTGLRLLLDDLPWGQHPQEVLFSFLKRVMEMQGHFQI